MINHPNVKMKQLRLLQHSPFSYSSVQTNTHTHTHTQTKTNKQTNKKHHKHVLNIRHSKNYTYRTQGFGN